MDLFDDKPRQHPKPVPFSQNALLEPAVPEVSLILQDNFDIKSEKKNNSFSVTEFQTYNSWRWKHLNHSATISDSENVNKFISSKDCCFFKDKYFTSDIEKRKNEILYGELEEPRRPLPPTTNPVLPASIKPFFGASFDDSESVYSIKERQQTALSSVSYTNLNMPMKCLSQKSIDKEIENSEKLYNIISEQNKQMQVLQNQMQQILKLQEVKDNHIEQLLKSQDLREKKIKQLLESLGLKDKEIEHLTNSKVKQEKQLEEFLKSQENFQKENIILQKKLNEVKLKQVFSIGVMACPQLADASTCTSSEDELRDSGIKNSENSSVEQITVLRESNKLDERDKSLSLHSSDLPVIQENIPTPQSSIHVDIQEFPDSSDDSESETKIPKFLNSFSGSEEAQSNPLGYTFYNNVLTQLKDIIQNSGEMENKCISEKLKVQEEIIKIPNTKCSFVIKTQEPVQAFSSYEKENILPANNQENIERFTDKFQSFCLKDTSSPSDISLKINALAMKYLKQEKISEFGLQNQSPASCQHDVTIYNVTNLSFGSMRYLDRYQMLPLVKDNQKQIINSDKNDHSPVEFLHRKRKVAVEENIKSSVGNILDISTLNQQPKLF